MLTGSPIAAVIAVKDIDRIAAGRHRTVIGYGVAVLALNAAVPREDRAGRLGGCGKRNRRYS